MTETKPKRGRKKSVATTRSTAGAGFAFEDLVAADLLSQMLLDLPIDGIGVAGDHLLSQAGAAGWRIDDLICVGHAADGVERRLALSCKSNVQVTATGWPADFMSAAWELWRKQDPFNKITDRIGLVTRGRNTAFDAIWSDLKQWCVGADPMLAMGRINASQRHRRVFDSIRNPGNLDGKHPTDAQTIALISALEIYPLDFQLSPSSAMTEAKRRCRIALRSESVPEAEQLWIILVQSVVAARLGNGITRLADILRDLAPRFALKAHPSIAGAWDRLLALSADERAGIETTLPNGHVVRRPKEAERLAHALGKAAGCVVIGESGAGKSALVRTTLGAAFPDAAQIWLGPEALGDMLSAARRHSIGVDHDLALILSRSPGRDKLLVLDSAERLDAATLTKLDTLLRALAGDGAWRVVLISQFAAYEDQLRALGTVATWPSVIVTTVPDGSVRAALNSVPTLAWISNDAEILPLLANLRTLGWIVAAASSFQQADGSGLTSTAAIADRLWNRWTNGPARSQIQRLLIRLAIREAAFERNFAISDLESGDLAAFDQRSQELPLQVNARNRIEFRHDLASDWARYQRLKEIADDIPQWSALAPQPLWIGALRLFGQFLLTQPDQARNGWDAAFAGVTTAKNLEAGDLLLDALCVDPSLDRHLAARMDLMFARDGALLKRLMHRFLHIATVPGIQEDFAVDEGLRIYLEADIRFPIIARWAPMGRFLAKNADRVASLGATVVARVCKAWLSLPRMLGEQPTPLRDVMAKVALETARTRQIENAGHQHHGGGDDEKLIYVTALSGAVDLPAEIAAFALEMAARRPPADMTLKRVQALREADCAEAQARAAAQPCRPKPASPRRFLSSRESLPPWPLGPSERLSRPFRDAVLHANGLNALMEVDPTVASEVLLACIIEDNPTRDYGHKLRLEGDLGLEFDQQSYPTIFWKSPFFAFFQLRPEQALEALKQLVDFVTERWASEAPPDATIPSISIATTDGSSRSFPGTRTQFGWSQQNSIANGQLFCALDALERWLILKAEAGEDMKPWCERLLALEGSTAILGVLVNLGKYRPGLFKGPLLPLVRVEALYHWDMQRVRNSGLGFDTFTWFRQGEAVLNMARDWVLAPHRALELREVIGVLAAADASFASQVISAAVAWPRPDDVKRQLEQRILQSELDPANRKAVLDANGETVVRLIHPDDLQADLIAYQTQANATLEPLTVPHQCEGALAGTADLTEASAEYLATLLPDPGSQLPDSSERLPMLAGAAATLIARGGDWYAQRPEIAARAEQLLRAVIAHVDALSTSRDDHAADQALRFAAIGALHIAVRAADPSPWSVPLAVSLTARGGNAIATLMRFARRLQASLGPAWYQLNFLLLLFAGLNRLSPRYEEEEVAPVWERWLARLRAQPIFGSTASIDIIDPAGIARRVERLLEARRTRKYPGRSARLAGKSRRFAGLSTHILEAGYDWLLDHETAHEAAQEPENHRLLTHLWAFEAWRMEGEGDGEPLEDDVDANEEYDLPSGMGYSILRIAPAFVMAAPANEPQPLWRAILAIGPRGHHAVEQFSAGWFLLLFKPIDADRFMAIWKAIILFAFDADWSSHRRWYYGRVTLTKLLGLNAPIELSQADAVLPRIPELIDYYRRWARTMMPYDEDDIATFCHFLTKESGRSLRLEGMIWLDEALAKNGRFSRGSTGNNIAEAIDTVLTGHARDLLVQPQSRDAVIAIVARLVRAQVETAMGLQRRIAALR